jgi:hypothetical protein
MYAIEEELKETLAQQGLTGLAADAARLAVRQAKALQELTALRQWLEQLTDRERTQSVSIDPVFASQKLSEEVDAWLDVPLFPDRSQALPEDGTQPNHSGNPNDDPMINYIWPGSNLLAD